MPKTLSSNLVSILILLNNDEEEKNIDIEERNCRVSSIGIYSSDFDLRFIRGRTIASCILIEASESRLKEEFPEHYLAIQRGMSTLGGQFTEIGG